MDSARRDALALYHLRHVLSPLALFRELLRLRSPRAQREPFGLFVLFFLLTSGSREQGLPLVLFVGVRFRLFVD